MPCSGPHLMGRELEYPLLPTPSPIFSHSCWCTGGCFFFLIWTWLFDLNRTWCSPCSSFLLAVHLFSVTWSGRISARQGKDRTNIFPSCSPQTCCLLFRYVLRMVCLDSESFVYGAVSPSDYEALGPWRWQFRCYVPAYYVAALWFWASDIITLNPCKLRYGYMWWN